MKIFGIALVSLFVLGGAANAQTPTTKKNTIAKPMTFPVVPGKSAGKVWLGASRETVRKILGKPTQSYGSANGVTIEQWLGKERKNAETGDTFWPRYAVLFKANRAIQIEWNAPHFQTADGVSSEANLAVFRHFFRPHLRAYLYADPEGGGHRGYVYDDVRRGIAFAFGAQDNYDARVLPEKLLIHRPGVRAIPEAGGVRKNYRDEIPVQE